MTLSWIGIGPHACVREWVGGGVTVWCMGEGFYAVIQNVSHIYSDRIIHSLRIPVHLAYPTPNSPHALSLLHTIHHTGKNVAVKSEGWQGKACVSM